MPLQGDERLVRRAARRLAWQAAAVTGTAMLLLVVVVTAFVVQGQASATDRLLRTAAATADDVGDPPSGAWLVLARGQAVQASPGLPPELESALVPLRVDAAQEALTTLRVGSHHYRVLTTTDRGDVVQAAFDLEPQLRDRGQLLEAMAIGAGLSLLIAGGLGIVLGRRAVRPLAQALRLQRSFIADASHELRTPLTLLSTRLQLLDAGLQRSQDPQVLEDSHGVVLDVQRLGEVIEDLLVAADPGADQPAAAVDLGELVTALARSARPHATAQGVSLSVDVAADTLVVRGSGSALRRAVLALLDNAIDHTPAGGDVRLSARRAGKQVVVVVSDTGSGIADQERSHVLRRFHSGGQRAGRSHYGLGLALTRDVAYRHGGSLRLVPAEVGATFELVLPALRD